MRNSLDKKSVSAVLMMLAVVAFLSGLVLTPGCGKGTIQLSPQDEGLAAYGASSLAASLAVKENALTPQLAAQIRQVVLAIKPTVDALNSGANIQGALAPVVQSATAQYVTDPTLQTVVCTVVSTALAKADQVLAAHPDWQAQKSQWLPIVDGVLDGAAAGLGPVAAAGTPAAASPTTQTGGGM